MTLKEPLKSISLCIITGLLAVCSFPKINLFFLAWIAFVPLSFVIIKSRLKTSFFYGFFSGFIFNIVGLYWLIPMLQFNTDSYVQAIIAACALWIYLALYWGAWSLFLNLSKKVLNSNILIILSSSCIWVLLEYIRTYFLTGFPWMLIGYSQFKFIEIIQIAEFTGVYGVSFLIIFCNLCFYFWISKPFIYWKLPIKKIEKIKEDKYLYIALTLILAASIFGAFRADKFRFFGTQEFTVAVVQPNINQYKKWDRYYKGDILSDLKKYAFKISEVKADLVLWPETTLMGFVPEDSQLYDCAKLITKTAGGFNIMGSPYNDENGNIFNAVLAFETGKVYKAVHKKNHLVLFGEYIPFRSFFSKFFGVLNQMGDFTKGVDTEIFDNGQICAGATICSENFFPGISRKFVLSGAKVLTNHTNDAWFFDTAAPYQHFIMNIFRAVETRKAVIVSANSGISGIIEASGIIVAKTPSSKNVLLTGNFLQNNFKTFYTNRGDLFIYMCAGLLLIIIFLYLSVTLVGVVMVKNRC
ncbi:MAG: apolipoprotein N-acyltransferase [Endomicrobium sp.]|jgi:apolipoprotein N-acyltransferase|nr:apolipoprotein N-acyltransferase [Endomicrobium sp.]